MKTRHRKHAKTVLRLAELEHAKSAVLNRLARPNLGGPMNSRFKTLSNGIVSEPRLALNGIVVTRSRMQLEQLHLSPIDD
jgi:hypothetical protein